MRPGPGQLYHLHEDGEPELVVVVSDSDRGSFQTLGLISGLLRWRSPDTDPCWIPWTDADTESMTCLGPLSL